MKDLLKYLGFIPVENTTDIYSKKYPLSSYEIIVDYKKEIIDYGKLILSESKTTQNFSQDENWVVLECIDRLLEKGYKPQDIILEKTWKLGHQEKGRLDILVQKEGKTYLMIECKTWGVEYEKELKKTQKDGGQLFGYFQQDRNADFLVLYASHFNGENVQYSNEIIKIEPDYRLMGNVVDLYNRWNKFSKQNGIFELWTRAYHFESKALTLGDLDEIRQEDSSFIFNRFLEILRHNAVSDKPNAFNKIFTLFLCKIKDEDKNSDEELEFQWKEGEDDAVSFQKRLSDLYKKGMEDFLKKEITDLSDDEFQKKFGVFITNDDTRKALLTEFTRIRLQKNNEFAIKEVFDEETFKDNAKVLKEVVELLQGYRFRYAKKQPFLGDFFELLLTTGLKQEAGQFFTPVPIARFISKSIPLEAITKKKLTAGATDEFLPNIIDYAAGSGHFLTESMEELQNIITRLNPADFPPSASRALKPWQHDNPFSWAQEYIYGIEIDYRLVKTTKVGCYLHGDGIANVIHGDGLDSFTDSNYVGKLKKKILGTQDNAQFDFVLANPPYSVSACKGNLKNKNADKDFELYKHLTDQSSQIESLFIERTKQLLSEGGIAAIILPSSILSNTGIYTKTREILLKYFEFIAITELGSGTFMATGTNTVILFLRRRSNYDAENITAGIQQFFINHTDNTILGIEKPFSKYIAHVWGTITLDDYITFINGTPTEAMKKHEICIEYEKKIKAKNPKEWLEIVRATEQDKILYFLLAYGQQVVLVKSGDKQDEKNFLGYEFSNAKGKEGIHPIKRGKQIDDCTLLFHPDESENPERINTYILDAFSGKHNRTIATNLEKYITRTDLVDMLTLDRAEFEKNISTSVKKKIVSRYELKKLEDIFLAIRNGKSVEQSDSVGKYRVSRIETIAKGVIDISSTKWTNDETEDEYFLQEGDILFSHINSPDHLAKTAFFTGISDKVIHGINLLLFRPNQAVIIPKYASSIFKTQWFIDACRVFTQKAANQASINTANLKTIKIPLPPLHIQAEIVREMVDVEKRENEMKGKIENAKGKIRNKFVDFPIGKISDIAEIVSEKINPTNHPDIEFVNVGLENIESNTGKLINKTFVLGSTIGSTKNVFGKGHILYGKLRPYLNKVFLSDFDGVCSTDILVVKSDCPKILKYLLLSDDFIAQASNMMEGTNLPRIKPEAFLNVKIPLPPLSEQHKIVAEIEKIEDEIVGLEAELAGIPSEKEAILKKYL